MQLSVSPNSEERTAGVRGRRFVAWVVVCALIQIALMEYLGWATLEGRPPAAAARLQQGNMPVVFFPTDARNWASFKLQRIADEQPEIIAIGNSRCSQLRSAMFMPYKFYNACLTAWTVSQLRDFLNRITEVSYPRVVIFSMDYFQLSNSYQRMEGKRAGTFRYGVEEHIGGIGSLIGQTIDSSGRGLEAAWECLAGRYPKHPREDLTMVGVTAARTGAGFRWDGSLIYQLAQYDAAKQVMLDFRNGLVNAIPGAPKADEEQLAQLAGMAADAEAKGILLVGIQFPIFAPTVDFLDHNEEYRPYAGAWRDFESETMKRRFTEMGIIHVDLSRAAMSKDPENFVDTSHPSEAGMVAALIEASGNAAFNAALPRLDITGLRGDLKRASDYVNHYHLYRSTFVK
ncbi:MULTISPECIES: hypothetical protein [unclassified Bradyrhizobium]|nr:MULTISPECIES: hypothetical protein [unclassified Bradyrhizobium]